MKLALLLILCCCLIGMALGDSVVVTKPSFIRSRYSLRWKKTTSVAPEVVTADGPTVHTVTTTDHPKLATSTASSDYDYYGNGETENVVHK
ncbi:uncharacterized protein LOC6554592 [Drosophila erecta]|uniref:GG11683 n=1 Tax=Drosophila erecta TaxID=7220 RepID=B3P5E7_DROER|nr:uncharacterized protein LOC6554592 [Drosophila erecta]EDV53197.1 uncharacterized protein Dere_GG11683 [Drosophila erecta]